MLREVEPELMTDSAQCLAYAESPGGIGLRTFFLYNFKSLHNVNGKFADLGCGPGLLDIELCKLYDITIDGFDGSSTMVSLARTNVKEAGVDDKIKIHQCNIDDVSGTYDWIICNNTLHHMHDPIKFWNKVKSLTTINSKIYITDILRPASEEDLEEIINVTTVGELPVVVTDFRNSLKASFTVEEIQEQIKDIFPTAKVTALKMERMAHLPFEMVSITV